MKCKRMNLLQYKMYYKINCMEVHTFKKYIGVVITSTAILVNYTNDEENVFIFIAL